MAKTAAETLEDIAKDNTLEDYRRDVLRLNKELRDLRAALKERAKWAHIHSGHWLGEFKDCLNKICEEARTLLAQPPAEGEDKPLTEAEELLGCRSFPACYTVPGRELCAVCAYFARRNAPRQPAEPEAGDKEAGK